jgi:acetolactate synthase-1/3 small subunit
MSEPAGATAAVMASDGQADDGSRHVVSALVVDRPGTLNRVAGLLRARSFNIESLTVGRTHQADRSRMTIVLRGDDRHTSQVLAQLNRLVEVLEVSDLTDAACVELELALVEIEAPRNDAARAGVEHALQIAGGELLASGADAWRLRLAAAPDAVEAALGALRGLSLRSLVRAGSVAMAVTTSSSSDR